MNTTPKGTRPVPRPIAEIPVPSGVPASPYELPPGRPPEFVTAADIPEPPKLPDELPPALEQKCCPEVATFEIAKTRSLYFAFDPTTNLPANPGADEYWIPPTKAKSLPSSKITRDGARWVSVGVGLETEVEIAFDGHKGAGCIVNCTYEVVPASIADVVTTAIAGSGVSFKIKGKAVGEASLKAICQGKEIGWYHIWCIQPVTINVDVASIVTPNSRAAVYSISDMEAYINEVYRQTLITVSLNDVGAVTVTPTLSTYSSTNLAHLNQMDALARAASSKFLADYRLYYYVDTAGHSGGLGVVSGGLGNPGPGFSFFDHHTDGSYNTMAHEFGHLLNLSHPLHDYDQDEFPLFQLNKMSPSANVLPDDQWNLMGYNGTLPQRGSSRKPLRYLQWKKCNRS